MKTIKFAKRWRRPTSSTAYEEYPAGCQVIVADTVAAAAKKAGVLDGEPVDAPAGDPADATATAESAAVSAESAAVSAESAGVEAETKRTSAKSTKA